MMLTENRYILFIKSICQFDTYITNIHIYLNYNYHIYAIKNNISIQYLYN